MGGKDFFEIFLYLISSNSNWHGSNVRKLVEDELFPAMKVVIEKDRFILFELPASVYYVASKKSYRINWDIFSKELKNQRSLYESKIKRWNLDSVLITQSTTSHDLFEIIRLFRTVDEELDFQAIKRHVNSDLKDLMVFNLGMLFKSELIQDRAIVDPWNLRILSHITKVRDLIRFSPSLSNMERKDFLKFYIKSTIQSLQWDFPLIDTLTNPDLLVLSKDQTFDIKETVKFILENTNNTLAIQTLGWIIDGVVNSKYKDETIKTSVVQNRFRLLEVLKASIDYFSENPDFRFVPHVKRLVDSGCFNIESIPGHYRSILYVSDATDRYLKNSEKFSNFFKKEQDTNKLRSAIYSLFPIVIELIYRKRFKEAATLLINIRNAINRKKTEDLRKVLAEARKRWETKGVVEVLIAGYQSSNRDIRKHIAYLLAYFYRTCIPYLLDLLKQSEDMSLRLDICRLLTKFGELATAKIIEELNNVSNPWYFHRNLLYILKSMDTKCSNLPLRKIIHDADYRVKIAAIELIEEKRLKDYSDVLLNLVLTGEYPIAKRAGQILLKFSPKSLEPVRVLLSNAIDTDDKERALIITSILKDMSGDFGLLKSNLLDALDKYFESIPRGLFKSAKDSIELDIVKNLLEASVHFLDSNDVSRILAYRKLSKPLQPYIESVAERISKKSL